MRATRKRSNDEVLSSLACTVSEAMRVLNCRYATVKDLLDTGKVHSFVDGKRTKISVESLKAYARGDVAESPAA